VYSHSLFLLTTHHRPPTFASLLFSFTYKSLVHRDRFAGPLFPYTYKSLFPQPLPCHINAKPWGCRGYAPSSTLRSLRLSLEKSPNSFPDKLLRTLEISLLSFSTSRPLFSVVCGLFVQNTGGMGGRTNRQNLRGVKRLLQEAQQRRQRQHSPRRGKDRLISHLRLHQVRSRLRRVHPQPAHSPASSGSLCPGSKSSRST